MAWNIGRVINALQATEEDFEKRIFGGRGTGGLPSEYEPGDGSHPELDTKWEAFAAVQAGFYQITKDLKAIQAQEEEPRFASALR